MNQFDHAWWRYAYPEDHQLIKVWLRSQIKIKKLKGKSELDGWFSLLKSKPNPNRRYPRRLLDHLGNRISYIYPRFNPGDGVSIRLRYEKGLIDRFRFIPATVYREQEGGLLEVIEDEPFMIKTNPQHILYVPMGTGVIYQLKQGVDNWTLCDSISGDLILGRRLRTRTVKAWEGLYNANRK